VHRSRTRSVVERVRRNLTGKAPFRCDARGVQQTRHLDNTRSRDHDAFTRTTATLDPDVERLIREAMHRSRKSFKETPNNAVRAALSGNRPARRPSPFVVKARPVRLRAGIDPGSLNTLADELDVHAFVTRNRSEVT